MDETNLILFLTVSLVVVPGPDSIYVLPRGVSQGGGAGLVSACAVCCGLLVHYSRCESLPHLKLVLADRTHGLT